ncbi:hypothetical protein AAVH_41863 [Aphelenchoides avenae]|nr:hypothetical protein AAVH_41863 [Aphelenchus avenae]
MMTKECCATCGRCGITGAACTDAPGSNCAVWKSQGFCDMDWYWNNGQIEQCRRTCGLCQ